MRSKLTGWGLCLLTTTLIACGSGSENDAGSATNTGASSNGDGDADASAGGAGSGEDASTAGDGDGDGGSSGNSSGGDGDGDGDGGPDLQGCAAVENDAKLAQANFLFVIDKSGSMDIAAVGDAQNRTRWEATRDALGEALDVLQGESNVRVGLSLFPVFDPILQCTIPEEPNVSVARLNDAHRTQLDLELDAVTPSGDTPIGGTMMYSYEFLRQQIVEEETLSGNTFVVLFTDGAETCDQDAIDSLVEENTSLATQFDIKTFVIGAPGSESERGRLSQIAFEGQTSTADDCDHSGDDDTGDCHFDMTESDDFAAELSEALQEIAADRSVRCDFQMPEGDQIDPRKVNVTYTNSETG
ncbi:MAG TPA: VWA domain-containing protein [Polyangiaceae bacterium]|nr:VWA domain-containing protein [Polyangiaceae bacterium]